MNREYGLHAIAEFLVDYWLRGGKFSWSPEMLKGLDDQQLKRVAKHGLIGDGILAELGLRNFRQGIDQSPEAREWTGVLASELEPYDTRHLSKEQQDKHPVQVVEDLGSLPPIEPPPGPLARTVDKDQWEKVIQVDSRNKEWEPPKGVA